MIECDNNEEFIIANLSSSVINETLDLAFNEGERGLRGLRGLLTCGYNAEDPSTVAGSSSRERWEINR